MDIPKRYLLVVLCSLLATAVSGMECPTGWYFFDGSCYHAFAIEVNWYEAKDTCAYNNAIVAEIKSKNENDFVENLANNAGITDAWLGMYSANDEWRYLSTDASVAYSNFAPVSKRDIRSAGRPQIPTLVVYRYAYLSSSREWAWATTSSANSRKGVVCRRCPLRDECSKALGKCYTLSCSRLASDDAQSQCRMHNSTLAEPKTEEEYNFVKQFLTGKDISKDPLGVFDNEIYIGGHSSEENQFVWRSSGEVIPRDFVGYAKSSPSSKGSTGREKSCLVMDPDYDYRFDYDECFQRMHYICERNIDAPRIDLVEWAYQ